MTHRIRWFKQFSILSLLTFTALVAILLAFPIRRNVERNRVIDSIKRAGGKVSYGKSFALPGFESAIVCNVAVPHSSAWEFDFTQLSVFPQLKFISIRNLPQPQRTGKLYSIAFQVTPETVKRYSYLKGR
jgi:hypothetical protein